MVLNVDIEFIPREIPSGKLSKYGHEDLYTVHVDSKRILTVVTDDDEIAAKWFQSLLKSTTGSNTKPMDRAATSFRSDSIFVGLIAETESVVYDSDGLRQTPYELLTVCAGSHCLIYDVPEAESGYYYPRNSGPPKLVKAFFQNPRVVVFGKDMAKVAKRLEEKHGIQIKNPVDVNELAEKGMQRPDLDLGRYDLDRLAMFVLGKHFDVYRPQEKKMYWENRRRYRTASDESHFPEYYYPRYTEKKIQFTTLDAYLFLLIGLAVLEHKVDVAAAAATGTNKKKKKLNKKSSG